MACERHYAEQILTVFQEESVHGLPGKIPELSGLNQSIPAFPGDRYLYYLNYFQSCSV